MGWIALGMLAYGLICMWGFGRWAKAAIGPGRGAEARAGTGTGIGTGALFRKDVGFQEMA